MTDELKPAYDNKIYRKYSKSTVKNKTENKLFLQKELWLPENKKIPMVCLTCELTDKNGAQLILDAIEWILSQNLQLVVLALGSEKYQNEFAELATKYSNKVKILSNDDTSKRKIYAASNVILIFSNSTNNLIELKNGLAYGNVPVSVADPVLKDFDPVSEDGNAFLFEPENVWSFFAALVRALENYRFSYDWENLELAAMSTFEE